MNGELSFFSLLSLATLDGFRALFNKGYAAQLDNGGKTIVLLINIVFWVACFVMLGKLIRYLRSRLGVARDLIREIEKTELHRGRSAVKKPVSPVLAGILAGNNSHKDFFGVSKSYDDKILLKAWPQDLQIRLKSLPRYFPGLLTGLGILGTFWGIAHGLETLDLSSLTGDNSEEFINRIKGLIGGMKEAFATSLAGLTAASLVMVGAMAFDGLARYYRDTLGKKLGKLARLQTATDLLSQMDPETQSKATMELGAAAQQIAKSASSLSSDAIGASVGRAVEAAIAGQLAPSFRHIAEELAALREIKADQGQKVLEGLVRDLRSQVIEPIVERLDRSAEMTEHAAATVSRLHKDLGNISVRLAGAVETIQTFQRDTLAQMESYTARLTATVETFVADSKTTFDEVARQVRLSVDESVRSMEHQRGAFQASAEQAAMTFHGIRDDLEKSLEKQQQAQWDMLQEVRQSIHRQLQAAAEHNKQQGEQLRQIGVEAAGLMGTARQELESGLSAIPKMLSATRQETQIELERFRRDYQAALTSFFAQQNDLLEKTLGEQRRGLASVVEQLQNVFVQGTELIKSANDFAGAIGLNSADRLEQLKELSRDMTRNMNRMQNAWQQMDQDFQRVLDQGAKRFMEALETVTAANRDSRDLLDESVSQVCTRLLRISEVLAMSSTRALDAVASRS